jgi:hypothetical protein
VERAGRACVSSVSGYEGADEFGHSAEGNGCGVRSDPHYLTAFGSTFSEIIIPILNPRDQVVVGTIDVESERANAFSDADRKNLEECARAALALWFKA